MSTLRITAASRGLLGVALAALAALAFGSSPALAVNTQLKEEFSAFAQCPWETAQECVASDTTGGEFVLGSKTVPIVNAIQLKGGLPLQISLFSDQKMIAPRDGNTLTSPPQKVPGGLLGVDFLEGIGGEVTATASLAGPASSIEVSQGALAAGGPVAAVVLPLKIKLDNALLGDQCTIGSESEPVVLQLKNVKPGTVTTPGKKKITKISGVTLEDSSFVAPAAKNCGLLTPLVNLLAGLPASSGKNRAVLIGSFEQTAASYALKYEKPPKEKKKK